MRNIKLLIQYDGTSFAGWQKQNNAPTIQKELETKLSLILKEPISINGAGRTDARVHALGQVANFLTHNQLSTERILHAVNYYLPKTIRVSQCEEVPLDFHARFSAWKREYKYLIYNDVTCLPFLRDYACFIKKPIDVNKLESSLKLLIGEHDFRNLASADDESINKVRRIYDINIETKGNEIALWIAANGFLRKMVRMIMGLVLEINLKNRPIDEVTRILSLKSRTHNYFTASPKGLYLNHVWY